MLKSSALSIEELLEQVTDQTTVLTPNRRLAATLHHQYQQFQQHQQFQSWLTPDILPLSSWVQRLFKESYIKHPDNFPLLLTQSQISFIWEKLIVQTKDTERLLLISETSDLVSSAWDLIKQWEINPDQPIFSTTQDYVALQKWILHFQSQCQDREWIDPASLPDFLIQKIKNNDVNLPQHILLVGFTELSPQINQLFQHCREKCCRMESYQLSQLNQHCVRTTLPDVNMEIQSMARWAKKIINEQPSATIACVLPSLDKIRNRVQQIFSDVFDDASQFNLSAGQPLCDYPIIQAALQFLQLNKKNMSADVFNCLLSSPFLGEAETEQMRRASLDRECRKNNLTHIHLEENQTLILQQCPLLSERIARFLAFCATQPEILSFSRWAKVFNECLTILGWPGERSISSEEHQTIETWLDLLNEFAALDYVGSPVNFLAAVAVLKKMAQNHLFQPRTPDSQVQVLGLLEAAGLTFDYLWVAGMDDLAWPPQPKPHPLIPKKLQQELQMPHATAPRELRFCETLTRQFKQSAGEVIFSFAAKRDKLELQPSPLIREMLEVTQDYFSLSHYQAPCELIYSQKRIEHMEDSQGPAIDTNQTTRGGVSIIKQQALCPFSAYAKWRLHAHELESPTTGLRAKDRGDLIHRVLEKIWNQLNDQATLLAQSEDALNDLIKICIQQIFEDTKYPIHQRAHYLYLEQTRMHQLIWNWLQLEKERPPFSVLNSEKSTEVTVGQLKLNLRMDRIDMLSSEKKLIIDYKTGKNNSIQNWFSDRPEEPQLPLYALTDMNNTAGIAFAQLVTGSHYFKGVCQYHLDIDGIKTLPEINSVAWKEQLNEWQQTFATLSDAFCAGDATVDPKDPPHTCEWCALKPLCRYHDGVISHE